MVQGNNQVGGGKEETRSVASQYTHTHRVRAERGREQATKPLKVLWLTTMTDINLQTFQQFPHVLKFRVSKIHMISMVSVCYDNQ